MKSVATERKSPFSTQAPCSRILVVRLPCGKVYPAGPVYLASLLRRAGAGAVRILDLAADDPRSGSPATGGESVNATQSRLHAEIVSFRPEIVAFSWRDIQVFSPQDADSGFRAAFTFLHERSPIRLLAASLRGLAKALAYTSGYSRNLALVTHAQRAFPNIEFVLGGPAIGIFGDTLAPKLPPRVRIFSQTSLGPFFEYLGLPLPKDPEEPQIELGFLETAFPQWTEYRGAAIGVQTKRGCPRECLYCLYPLLEGRQPRRRESSAVAAEIAAYAKRWGTKRFWLADAQLLSVDADKAHLAEILQRIVAADLGIKWSGYFRVSELGGELASLMVRSGLDELEVSIGSGSQKVVDALKLGFSLADAMRGLEAIKAAGYRGRVLVNLSLNAPGETKETLAETLAVVDRIRALFGAERVIPVVFFLAIQPGTGLEALALEEGRLRPGYDPLSIWPWRARRLIYNPPPLGSMIGRACAQAFRGGLEGQGDRILAAIGREL